MGRGRAAIIFLSVVALVLVGFEMSRNARGECLDTDSGAGACGVYLPEAARKAETGAKTFARVPPPDKPPALFEGKTAGASARECVEVEDDVVRSGEFVAGNFRPFIRSWSDLERGKIWWAPLHQESMKGLKVEAIPLVNEGKQRTYSFPDRASNSNGAFYPSEMDLSAAGYWRLVATSGPDWGCFDLDVTTKVDS